MQFFDIFVDEVELKEHFSVSAKEENSSLWLPASLPPDAPATSSQFPGSIRSQEIVTRHVVYDARTKMFIA
jgi:hypothetical protein